MNLYADKNGYIYFNEILFYAMKRIYSTKYIKNKYLIQNEIKAMQTILAIKYQMGYT